MPATTTHRPAAAVTAAPTATPRQDDLLDALSSAATQPAAHREAKLWYPMSYNLWLEHNG
jgi:hypothetical protein